jgi:DhnA family fructose-bisphosphate aldolase class Ia
MTFDVSTSAAGCGRRRRMRRLFSNPSGRMVLVPLDDSLLAGPTNGLEVVLPKLTSILAGAPDAIMGFPGLFRWNANLLLDMPAILNLTASTTRSAHTRKTLVASVDLGVALGCEAVAVHVNIGSTFETEILRTLGEIALACDLAGMPLMAIMYPRKEAADGDDNYLQMKQQDRTQYAQLVAHAARVGVDMGADLIKTQYTGDVESFRMLIEASRPVPVLIAGGPMIPVQQVLQNAHDAVTAGAGGVSFGRNVFGRRNPQPYVTALRWIVHERATVETALAKVGLTPE